MPSYQSTFNFRPLGAILFNIAKIIKINMNYTHILLLFVIIKIKIKIIPDHTKKQKKILKIIYYYFLHLFLKNYNLKN